MAINYIGDLVRLLSIAIYNFPLHCYHILSQFSHNFICIIFYSNAVNNGAAKTKAKRKRVTSFRIEFNFTLLQIPNCENLKQNNIGRHGEAKGI